MRIISPAVALIERIDIGWDVEDAELETGRFNDLATGTTIGYRVG